MNALPAPAIPDPVAHQRARGRAEVRLKPGPGGAAPDRLLQEGCAKAVLGLGLPCPEVVFLNTAGGLTGGDRLDLALDVPGALRVAATTQTAERAYAAAGGSAQVAVRLSVGPDGFLDWLPQETILYDGAALEREVTVDLAEGAGCLFLESVVLGRQAMGESVRGLAFRDRREVRRCGRPVWSEPLAFDTRTLARAGGPAILGGARAFATLALIAPGAPDLLGPLHAVLDEDGVESGASAMEDRLVARLLAWDGLPLRRQILRALAVLRPGLALPRVWPT